MRCRNALLFMEDWAILGNSTLLIQEPERDILDLERLTEMKLNSWRSFALFFSSSKI